MLNPYFKNFKKIIHVGLNILSPTWIIFRLIFPLASRSLSEVEGFPYFCTTDESNRTTYYHYIDHKL